MKLIQLFLLVACALMFSSCSSGGSKETQVVSISYPQQTYALQGEPVPTIRPTVEGKATSFSLSGALPPGLNFSTSTGEITGTPTGEATGFTQYTVTSGSKTATFEIAVVPSKADIDIKPETDVELSVSGVDPSKFNPTNVRIEFRPKTGYFSAEQDSATITVNGNPVSSTSISIKNDLISADVVLEDGKNELVLKTYDSREIPIEYSMTLWAGNNTQRVWLTSPGGNPFSGVANVSVKLSDDLGIEITSEASGGAVTFSNLPSRTLIYEANAQNAFGTAAAIGNQGDVSLVLQPFNTPSNVDNNDLSQGLSGWSAGLASTVSIVPHEEVTIQPLSVASFSSVAPAKTAPGAPYQSRAQADQAMRQKWKSKAQAPTGSSATFSAVNNDIRLMTSGQGPQTLSRTFVLKPGVKKASVRYRFVTSEVPGGYFGSEFNDHYSVAVRSAGTGKNQVDSASMNGLGLGAFDFSSGSTAYRTVTLTDLTEGDTIQVDVLVANVGDGALDSFVDVDFIEESATVIKPSLSWNESDGGLDLKYVVQGEALSSDTKIEVFWANGSNSGSKIGSAIFTANVAAGTVAGSYGPVRIEGTLLTEDPSGVTHLIAVANTEVGSVVDTKIAYGLSAIASVVSAGMKDVLKDGGRVAGKSSVYVSSTARTPFDQARAMFNNLVSTSRTIQGNIDYQIGEYASPGEQVIAVFADMAKDSNGNLRTRDEILADATPIKAAMEAKIKVLGPSTVSLHCADPTVVSVVDVPYSLFPGASKGRFSTFVGGRVRLLIENSVFHLELNN